MAGIKMTFRGSKFLDMILEDQPVSIDMGELVLNALESVWGHAAVLGVPFYFDKDLEDYDIVMNLTDIDADGARKVRKYGPEVWMERPNLPLEQAPPAVAEMKQVCDTERVKGE